MKLLMKRILTYQTKKKYPDRLVSEPFSFNDLYNQRIKDVTFTWDKILSFDGETGPYVQYTYARAASVFRKTGITEVPGEIDLFLINR